MAVSTNGLIECAIAIRVAVPASKTGTVCTFRVRSQRISGRLMRELKILENRKRRIHAMMVGMTVSA
jgi:hypothetical protein